MTVVSYSANSTSSDAYWPLTTLKIDVVNPFATSEKKVDIKFFGIN